MLGTHEQHDGGPPRGEELPAPVQRGKMDIGPDSRAIDVGGEDAELEVPLLDPVDQRNELGRDQESKGGSTICGTVFNVANAVIGTGVVALPYKMAKVGVLLGVLLNGVVSVLVGLSAAAVLRAGDRCAERTYTGIVKAELGKRWGIFIRWCTIIAHGGMLVVSVIIIGDTFVGSTKVRGLIPDLTDIEPDTIWYYRRWFVTLVVTIVFLMPLVSLRSLCNLAHVSTLGIMVAFLFASIGIVVGAISTIHSSIDGVHWVKTADQTSWDLVVSICGAVSTYVFAYYANPSIPPLMEELLSYSYSRMMKATKMGIILIFGFYIVVSVSLYIAFQNGTEGDVLLNLTPTNLSPKVGPVLGKILGTTVLFGYALKVMLYFPMINWPLRENLSDMFWGTSRPSGWRFHVLSYGILAWVYLLSLLIKEIVMAIDFVGATAGLGITFLAPAALIFRNEWGNRGSLPQFILFFLVSVLVFGGTIIEHARHVI